MESYVIRIYRRHEAEPERVVGLVEHPDNGAVERFSGVTELVSILLAPPQNHVAVTPEKAPNVTNQIGSDESGMRLSNSLRHRNRSQ